MKTISTTDYKNTDILKSFINLPSPELILKEKLEKGILGQEDFEQAMEVLDLIKGKKAANDGTRSKDGKRIKKDGEWVPNIGAHFKDPEAKKDHEIGKTNSGKAIMNDTRGDHKGYNNFTAEDHKDAARKHQEMGDKHKERAEVEDNSHKKDLLNNMAISHHKRAEEHKDEAADKEIKKGLKPSDLNDKSKEIGKTQSGKAVHEDKKPNDEMYKGFTDEDHEDASEMHAEKSKHHAKMASRSTEAGDIDEHYKKATKHKKLAVAHKEASE